MLTVIEIITGYFFQGLSFVLAIYAFCKVKIDTKRFLLSSVLMILVIFLTCHLPILKGVKTLLNLLALIGLSYGVNRLPLMRTVIGCLSTAVLMLVAELANEFIFTMIYGAERLGQLKQDDAFLSMMAVPVVLIFMGAVAVLYLVRTRKRRD